MRISTSGSTVTARWSIAAATAAALSGCSTAQQAPSPGAASASSISEAPTAACAETSAPMSEIPHKAGAEPLMRIPQPDGWERSTQMDSELIRYVVVNSGLFANSFAPNVVVTLERINGTDQTPQQVLDAERNGLVSMGGATDLVVTPGTVCGLKAETVTYTAAGAGAAPPRPDTVLIVVGPFGGDTYAATVTAQTTDEGNADYQRDTRTILDGFEMGPADRS